MTQTPLQKLIDLGAEGTSDARRLILREITDKMMVSADRYGRRDMVYFDLLLSRSAQAMDLRVRRLLAMALIRGGAREEVVRKLLTELPSPNGKFLRRSVVQSRSDLFEILKENVRDVPDAGDKALSDGNSLTLPSLFMVYLYHFQTTAYYEALQPRIGEDRASLLVRTAERFRDKVIDEAAKDARDEVVIARRTVKEWGRAKSITDEVFAELVESRAMTEFIFALMEKFDVDCATTFRILNDTTFESFAIAARANGMRRSVFAKTIFGFRHRKTDQVNAERILGVYERLPEEMAERAMRFWRVRAADVQSENDVQPLAQTG